MCKESSAGYAVTFKGNEGRIKEISFNAVTNAFEANFYDRLAKTPTKVKLSEIRYRNKKSEAAVKEVTNFITSSLKLEPAHN